MKVKEVNNITDKHQYLWPHIHEGAHGLSAGMLLIDEFYKTFLNRMDLTFTAHLTLASILNFFYTILSYIRR